MNKDKFMYTTDILIFSIDSRYNDNIRELPKKYFSILLVKRDKEPFKDMWTLPGGYIEYNEESIDAAKRVLKKETNLSDVYIEKLGIYDSVNRDPRGRTISSAFIALIDKSKIKNELSEDAKWFDIEIEENNNSNIINLVNQNDEINIKIKKDIINKEANQYEYILDSSNNIGFDHGLIINDGIINLRLKANHSDIIFNLMPQEFTIGELKQVYEIILGKELINSVFRRTIASKVTEVKEIIKTGGHRPSKKFTYKKN